MFIFIYIIYGKKIINNEKEDLLPRFQNQNFQQGGGGGGGRGAEGFGLWISPAIGDRRRSMAKASGNGDGGRRLSFWSGGWGVFFPDFDRFSSSSSRSWFRRKSVLRFALIETEVRRKSRSWFFVSDRSVLRLAICNFVFMLWVLLG